MRSTLQWRQLGLRAATTLLGVVASFCTLYAIGKAAGVGPQPAILAAILAIILARRDVPRSFRDLALACGRIALVALVATSIGWLLHAAPALGAVLFVAGMFLSVWSRNFGERGRGVGALIATPLVAMLVVPGATPAPGGPLVDVALALGAGLGALAWVTAIEWLARRCGLATPAARAAAPPRAGPVRAGLTPATRMAFQMGVALSAAFLAGFYAFPRHWGWVVLTAFIVCSGARGRGDAVYKAALRLAGALVGTLAAAALIDLWAPAGIAEASAIFVILYAGLWLREINYAYWACSTTLILALLAHADTSVTWPLLAGRLEAIFVGAVCGVVAAWYVFPIRTDAIVRLRLAGALLALDEFVANAHLTEAERSGKRAAFESSLTELDLVDPPVRWHRRLFARKRDANHPARWIDLARELRPQERYSERESATIRRAIGISRRALANHGKEVAEQSVSVGDALHTLRELFAPRSA